MINVSMTIRSLEREIINTKNLLDNFVVRKGHSLLDHTIARYVWSSLTTSNAILSLTKGKIFNGLDPLVRNLVEIVFTLNYIYNSKNPDECAAKIFAWEIAHHEKAEKEMPSFASRDGEDVFDASIAFNVICKELREMGEDTKYVEKAFHEVTQKQKAHWHWSGMSPGALVKQYKVKTELSEIDLLMSAYYKHMWSSFSSTTHASARWQNPYITPCLTEKFSIADPLEIDPTRAAAIAGLSGLLMDTIHLETKEFISESF